MAKETDFSNALNQLSYFQQGAVIEHADIGLETLHSMVKVDTIDTRPVFQRRDRWDPKKQSRLIESFLTNIPVPPVYLAEDELGSYQVIDGKQRLTAVRDFFDDTLRLKELEKVTSLEGARYSDLPPQVQSNLRLKTLRVITVMRSSRAELKHEVFLRLNTGGEPLNAQEIRNVAFRGPLNRRIYELSENTFLRSQLKIRSQSREDPAFRNMTDAEWVVRFLALRASWWTFTGDLRRALDDFMETNAQSSSVEIDAMSNDFEQAITAAETIWGSDAFKWPGRDQSIAGLWDAQMLALEYLDVKSSQLSATDIASIRNRADALFKETKFDEYVRRATNTPERLKYRVTRMAEAIGGSPVTV